MAADTPALLHRAVLRPADGEIIDHINGDTLDNRRENLRIVPHTINSRNITGARKNGSHGAIGVTWNKRQWQAQIRMNGRLKHIGVYPTFEAAREARRVAEIELWGIEPRRESELLVNQVGRPPVSELDVHLSQTPQTQAVIGRSERIRTSDPLVPNQIVTVEIVEVRPTVSGLFAVDESRG